MISIFGDAELDEEMFMKLYLKEQNMTNNCWWIIDYNRQSLDGIIHGKLFESINLFSLMGWEVKILKYGKKLQKLEQVKGGKRYYAG